MPTTQRRQPNVVRAYLRNDEMSMSMRQRHRKSKCLACRCVSPYSHLGRLSKPNVDEIARGPIGDAATQKRACAW